MLRIVIALFITLWTSIALAQTQTNLINFHVVDAKVYRSGALTSRAAVAEVKALGVRTIISLEGDKSAISREQVWAAQEGLTFISAPVSEITGPSVDFLLRIQSVITGSELPVLIHCRRGSDRTGMVVGAYRVIYYRWPASTAIREMRSLGHYPWLYWWDERLEEL